MTGRDIHHRASILPEPRSHAVGNSAEKTAGKVDGSFTNSNSSRVTSSSLIIAWSIILLVFFTFFNHYIAYYEPETIGGVSKWIRYPILTEAFSLWLPIFVATLIAFIIGHMSLIYFRKHLIQETIPGVLNLFVIATVLSLLFIFPFNFSAIPHTTIASTLYMFVRVALIGISVVLGIGTLVRFIRLIINLSLHRV